MRTFAAEKYRNDLAALEYRVVATDSREIRIMAEALSQSDAAELAKAMNNLDQYYNG